MAGMIALITGASSGIGRSLALLFAQNGYDLVLVARGEAALQELAHEANRQGRTARVMPADLGVAGGVEDLHARLQRDGIDVDVLVNNAGVGMLGPFHELPLDRQVGMIQLNVTSLTALTRLMLPPMLARRRGGVLNVASTAAFQPGPLMAVYYATKAYVLSFSEALAEEVAGTGLQVTCLAPGPTYTEFIERAAMAHTRIVAGGAMTADEVARQGFEGWKAGRRLVIPGARNRFGAMAVKFAPRAFVTRFVKRLNSPA
jgi:short-subunit dehydrogenase